MIRRLKNEVLSDLPPKRRETVVMKIPDDYIKQGIERLQAGQDEKRREEKARRGDRRINGTHEKGREEKRAGGHEDS